MVTEPQLTKFCSIFGFKRDPKLIVVENEDAALDHRHGLWHRCEMGVSTTTGHQERLHETFNSVTKDCHLFHLRLQNVVDEIMKLYETFTEKCGRQAKSTLKYLKDEARKRGLPGTAKCTVQGCGWSRIFSYRFGIENFPCIHTAGTSKVEFGSVERPVCAVQEHKVDTRLTPREWGSEPASHDEPEIPEKPETNQEDTKEAPGFMKQLASELMSLNKRKFPDWTNTVIALCREWYQRPDQTDTKEVRSQFRADWWQRAKKGTQQNEE
jgi:hypothetical protein